MGHADPTPGECCAGLSLHTQISGAQEGGRWWLVSNRGAATTRFPSQLHCSPQLSLPKGETTGPCSSKRVPPAAACRHGLPTNEALPLTQTDPSARPDPLAPKCGDHEPSQALLVPMSPSLHKSQRL